MNLQRFLEAQNGMYDTALQEVRNGRKQSHWMWFIFPQLKGLGFSSTARFYGIENLEEAKSYLSHPILGSRLREITAALLELPTSNAHQIFGNPDDLKLKSCLTLFAKAEVVNENIFQKVLEAYFEGKEDEKTLKLLEK